MARLLHGRPLAERISAATSEHAAALRGRGTVPTLAIVSVGADPPALAYAARLVRGGHACGVEVREVRLGRDTETDALTRELDALGADMAVHGVILLTPLPTHLDEHALDERVPAAKDVDGQHPLNAGYLVDGHPRFVPSTADAVLELLRHHEVPLAGARATIIGRSTVVGRPLAHLLLLADATVTLAHSRTRDLARHTRDADIVVVAVGRAGFLRGEMIAPGTVVVDAGINVAPTGIVGDVDVESVAAVASAYSPVPGGLGIVTTALLLRNVVRAAEAAAAG